MSTLQELLTRMNKVLLPVEESECSHRAVVFAGCLLAPFSSEVVQEVDVVHVLSAGYMQTSAQRIDFRVEVLKHTDIFRKLRESYLEEKVYPLLDKVLEELRQAGVKAEIKKKVLEGDPAREIVRYAKEGEFHTVIMGRRALSCLKEKFVGSCSLAVCHRAGAHSTYVVGPLVRDRACPIPRILIPIDGSKPSLAAMKEASGIALSFRERIEKFTLLYVVDTAYDPERLQERMEEGERLLTELKAQVLGYGLPESLVDTEIRIGRPADEIITCAEEGGYHLIMMGRRGLSGIKELIVGSVSTKVLHRAEEFTVALIAS